VPATFYFFISYIYSNDKLLKNDYEKYKKKKPLGASFKFFASNGILVFSL
jgi:hypothetical protein